MTWLCSGCRGKEGLGHACGSSFRSEQYFAWQPNAVCFDVIFSHGSGYYRWHAGTYILLEDEAQRLKGLLFHSSCTCPDGLAHCVMVPCSDNSGWGEAWAGFCDIPCFRTVPCTQARPSASTGNSFDRRFLDFQFPPAGGWGCTHLLSSAKHTTANTQNITAHATTKVILARLSSLMVWLSQTLSLCSIGGRGLGKEACLP